MNIFQQALCYISDTLIWIACKSAQRHVYNIIYPNNLLVFFKLIFFVFVINIIKK